LDTGARACYVGEAQGEWQVSDTISGVIGQSITLGSAGYASPLTITNTGTVRGGYPDAVTADGDQQTLITSGLIEALAGVTFAVGPVGDLAGLQAEGAVSLDVTNSGTILGGSGNYETAGTSIKSVDGGAGIVLGTSDTLYNGGFIAGGYGGQAFGGVGVYVGGGSVLYNAGTISGGAGWDGGTTGTVTADSVSFTGAGTLVVEPGAVFNGNVVADSQDELILVDPTATELAQVGTLFQGFGTVASVNETSALVATSAGGAHETVTFTGASESGTFVPRSPAGSAGANNLIVFNWDLQAQLASFLSAVASGAGATIISIGDSTTRGLGAATTNYEQLSYPSELTQALNADGVGAQDNNFLGDQNDNSAVSLFGGAFQSSIITAGGESIGMLQAGAGFTFTLDNAGSFNRLTISYLDYGNGTVTVSVGGSQTVLATLSIGSTLETLTQTIDLPAGSYQSVTVTSASSNPVDIQGVSFANSTSGAIQVYNAGIGGYDSTSMNTSVYQGQALVGSAEGYGPVASALALSPSLAIVDIGIDDYVWGTGTAATVAQNLTDIITNLQNAGSDVIIVIPEPFDLTGYDADITTLRAALQNVSLSMNVPLIDLSASYSDNFNTLWSEALMSDPLHPDATLYADIGSQIASLLANAINGTTGGQADMVTASGANASVSGTAAVNTLVGGGANDTFMVNAADQSDTVINSANGSGTLDFSAATHDQLWFEQSGNDLVIQVLGTYQEVVVQNWFAGGALHSIVTSDGYTLTSGVAGLVEAMALYSADAGFTASAATDTSLNDSTYAAVNTAYVTSWSDTAPCFCAGTRLRTPRGEVAVEELRAGDEVVTAFAGVQRIRWTGRRAYEGRFVRGNHLVLPVCLKAGALGEGVPGRDLWVSPDHAICEGGVLVHAWRLVNGVSIVQAPEVERVSYHHIELDGHHIVFAENCPTESFLDAGCRRRFQSGEGVPGTAAKPCLPLVESGFHLEAIRRGIAARAGIAPPAAAPGPLRGCLDEAGACIRGWAQDVGAPEQPVALEVLVDGAVVAVVLANAYRRDLRAAGLGSGCHGFSLALAVTGVVELRRVADGAVLGRALARAA
jgi:hypothetical protein